MKVLVIGSGGREHAIIQKLHESKKIDKLYAAPGNGGISEIATCFPVKATDIDGIVEIAKANSIDLVFVAPDDPLILGMVDRLEAEGIRAFGPRQNAAIIEGSKVFSKELMKKYNIPTADYEVFTSSLEVLEYIKNQNKYPVVIKAEGLALGKGVVIAADFVEAQIAVKNIMEDKIFGDSGNRVVIEEFLTGPEVSVLAFTDGKTVVPMLSAQDHKKAFDDDLGPNTGGMGALSPSRIYTKEVANYCMKTIFQPTIDAMAKEGRLFKGVIYFGLIMTQNGIKVIEYNARFGDPEAQVVLPLLKTDLFDIINAVIDEKLGTINIEWYDNTAVCVVLASGGYPGKYKTEFEINGISDLQNKKDILLYHAGTTNKDGKFLTSGGRIIGVTAISDTLDTAIDKAYLAVDKINFKDMHFRRDIGIKK